jgi:hypothetical protein
MSVAGNIAKVVERLPSKHEDLSSNPELSRKKRNIVSANKVP